MVVATRAPVLGAGFVSLLLNPAHRIFTPAHVHVAEIDSIDLAARHVVTSRPESAWAGGDCAAVPHPTGGWLACRTRGWRGDTTIDLEAVTRKRDAASG